MEQENLLSFTQLEFLKAAIKHWISCLSIPDAPENQLGVAMPYGLVLDWGRKVTTQERQLLADFIFEQIAYCNLSIAMSYHRHNLNAWLKVGAAFTLGSHVFAHVKDFPYSKMKIFKSRAFTHDEKAETHYYAYSAFMVNPASAQPIKAEDFNLSESPLD